MRHYERYLRWFIAFVLLSGWVTARAEPPPPIAIGFYTQVIRDFPRKDVEVSLRFWTDELARSLNLTYKPIQLYDNLDDLRRDMVAGKINFMVASSMGVVQHFSADEISDGFSGNKSTPNYLLLVVRRGAGIQTPSDLARKRVMLLENDELSDIYLETLLLKAWGKPDWARLGSVSREPRSVKLVNGLFFGQADAALIDRSAYEAALALNPQIGQRLQVLEDYTFKGGSPHIGLFSSRMRPEDRERITEAALKLNDTVRGRQVLDIYQADSMVRTSVKDLIPYRELLETHSALMAVAKSKARRKRP
ncbi:MAG: PhnD/SsuA/transferrin family substrate-binding protein [Parasulfuritortus sp.]|jgi:hypothetical protein|nr:PhnD/SsuA/transferrin family substrate-binding protein [Parasulfuritortus sp.]